MLHLEKGMPPVFASNELVWVKSKSMQYLIRVEIINSPGSFSSTKSSRFETFIDKDLEDAAESRSTSLHLGMIPTVLATDISGFPDTIPATAARKPL